MARTSPSKAQTSKAQILRKSTKKSRKKRQSNKRKPKRRISIITTLRQEVVVQNKEKPYFSPPRPCEVCSICARASLVADLAGHFGAFCHNSLFPDFIVLLRYDTFFSRL
jgi:hypothetical protein